MPIDAKAAQNDESARDAKQTRVSLCFLERKRAVKKTTCLEFQAKVNSLQYRLHCIHTARAVTNYAADDLRLSRKLELAVLCSR